MISAYDAKEISCKNDDLELSKFMEYLDQKIRKAAELSRFSVLVDTPENKYVLDNAKKELLSLGYVILDDNKNTFEIHWGEL